MLAMTEPGPTQQINELVYSKLSSADASAAKDAVNEFTRTMLRYSPRDPLPTLRTLLKFGEHSGSQPWDLGPTRQPPF